MRISDAEDAAAAAHDVGDAAGVRHREGVGHGEGGVHPVVVRLGAAAGQLDKCVFNIATGYLQILTLLNMEKLQSWLITIKPSVSLARIVRLNRKQIKNLNEEI